jgi:uncharacterized protein (DUF1501 family)
MDALTRRKFLRASAVAGAAAIGAGSVALGIEGLLRTATDGSGTSPVELTSKLVLVTLYGGNDGLNTVIPYADPAYHSARPQLAYRPEDVLRLDESLGLNPALTGLSQLWKRRMLAIVRGVGYPKPDRSHFRSMDIWQTGSPSHPVGSGWIGRWLDSTRAAPQTAVSFESVLPPLLVGESRVGSCVSIDSSRLPTGITTTMLDMLGHSQPNEPDLVAKAAASYADLVKMDQLIQDAEHGGGSPSEDLPEIPATATGGDNALATQLSVVTRCVEAGVPTRIYSVSLGGFDTHANERAGQERLLKQVDVALAGFLARMAKTEAGRRVTVVVYSEFGRRVQANGSHGTDHGTAGPMFVLGAQVAGGFYGEQPSLTDLDNGDLKATTDFRDVFGTVLASVLKADPARYFGGYQPRPLPLFPAR